MQATENSKMYIRKRIQIFGFELIDIFHRDTYRYLIQTILPIYGPTNNDQNLVIHFNFFYGENQKKKENKLVALLGICKLESEQISFHC